LPSEAFPNLTVLSFDTSAAHCAAALLDGERVVASRTEDMAKGQAERLIPLLEELLTEAGLEWSDLDAIAVGVGPGNFTGIRISVAAARGLALALDIPAIGVSSFETLVYGRTNVIACLPAPRDHVYVQSFGADSDTTPRHARLAAADMPRFDGRAEPVAIGPAADQVAALLTLSTAAPCYPLAEGMARHAAALYRVTAAKGPIPSPAPLYLRAADAAPSRDAPPVMLP
jgi:tRNA threonylcarbamoyl adenosine modification protein YeaZ